MKKILTLTLISFLAVLAGNAQVGIGTTNPQETLHIAGSESTVRIEALSKTNHLNNLGGTGVYNVVADEDGTITLGKMSGELVSESNIPVPIVVQTQANSGLKRTELYSKSFTLTQKAMVVITYYVALDFASYDGTAKIDDGRAKIAHNYFFLGNGTTADPSKSYGMTSVVYTNMNCDTATGIVYNSRSTTVALDAGTYSVHLNGAVYGGGLTAEAAFRVSFGNGDRLDIQAIYL